MAFFGMEIVERKDKPKERGRDKYHEYGKTGSLLLRLCILLFMTGNVVIPDSGFCVLLDVIALKKMGVFSAALINKRRDWPLYVKGEEIKAHFEDAPVGDSHILPVEINGAKFDLFGLKEVDYVMKLMSTY